MSTAYMYLIAPVNGFTSHDPRFLFYNNTAADLRIITLVLDRCSKTACYSLCSRRAHHLSHREMDPTYSAP